MEIEESSGIDQCFLIVFALFMVGFFVGGVYAGFNLTKDQILSDKNLELKAIQSSIDGSQICLSQKGIPIYNQQNNLSDCIK
jgi:hypothetical protein